MAEPQAEPFQIALNHLRARLQRGELPPGARLAAVDLADALRLSTTPVREALSRLAGEGLVEERRGQGYFVRPLSAPDIADLYRMSLAHLLIALEPRRPRRPAPGGPSPTPEDPVARVEALFRGWVGATGSRLLIRSFRILQIQLGPVRRLERHVVGDLGPEAERLAGLAEDGSRGERLGGLRQFHALRIREAARLAALLEASAAAARK